MMEKAAKLVRDTAGADGSVPCIIGGDFNSLPISSVLSAFYNENIESTDEETLLMNPSVWQLENPPFINTNSNQIPQEKQEMYKTLNKILARKIDYGHLDPLIGNLQTAYQNYQAPPTHMATDETLTRD